MFIGHYGPALAIKRVSPKAPMWALFAAVQIMDVFWATFMQFGIERAHIDASHPAQPLSLDYMPYTHSLVGALGISFAFALLVSAMTKGARANVLIWVTIAGFSHWLLDLLVHFPDLTIFGGPPKFGFALWRYFWLEFWLEIVVVLAGLALYLSATVAKGVIGRLAPWIVTALMFAVFYIGKTMPPPTDPKTPALMGLGVYVVLILCGLWLDRVRSPKAASA
jgi:hypothetical protein